MTLQPPKLVSTLILSTIFILLLVWLVNLRSHPTTARRSTTGGNSVNLQCRPIPSLFTTQLDAGSIYTNLAWSQPSTAVTYYCSPKTTLIEPLVGSLKQKQQCLTYLKPVQATLTRERWTKSTTMCLRSEPEGR